MDSAPLPDAAGDLRPTVRRRTWIAPRLFHDSLTDLGLQPDHPYVRRYWTAVLGPGAVADLLRLITAARTLRPLARPSHLGALAREDLVRFHSGRVYVRDAVPLLSACHVRRLPPFLRAEHGELRWEEELRSNP